MVRVERLVLHLSSCGDRDRDPTGRRCANTAMCGAVAAAPPLPLVAWSACSFSFVLVGAA
jgi:hypothetical protein